jgi:hypothetical protein
MRMSNLIIGHARAAGVRSGFEGGMRIPECRGLTAERQGDPNACSSRRHPGLASRPGTTTNYGFASPARSTALQAAGIWASVIGGFGFGGSGGGFGCSTPSLNQ